VNPLRLFSTGIFPQVFERSDVVNLDSIRSAGCSALFARLGQEPFFEF
jgi:hypothetical protein